jgi:ACR3 family arsenite transporter
MVVFAVIFLDNYPGYMSRLILIGMAPCIARVIVWNDLASDNHEFGTIFLALIIVFQLIIATVSMPESSSRGCRNVWE